MYNLLFLKSCVDCAEVDIYRYTYILDQSQEGNGRNKTADQGLKEREKKNKSTLEFLTSRPCETVNFEYFLNQHSRVYSGKKFRLAFRTHKHYIQEFF